MNPILAKCLSRLTADWQALSAIKLTPNSGAQGFADLVWEGLAEDKREPIVRNGIACGERLFYRLKTQPAQY